METMPPLAATADGPGAAHNVEELFNRFDEDGSGELDMAEVRKLCKCLGQRLNNQM